MSANGASANGADPGARARRKSAGRARRGGTLPALRLDGDLDYHRQWLTIAFAPQDGYEFESFERSSQRKVDPCTLTFRNGRDRRRFDLEQAADLIGPKLRATVFAVGAGFLRMGNLKPPEISDVWASLCCVGELESNYDDRVEATKWLVQLLDDSRPLRGLTLEPSGRHDALTAITDGEFRRMDAEGMLRGTDEIMPRRPVRFIDARTGEQYVRAGETFVYVKWIAGEMRLDRRGLHARLRRIGVEAYRFEQNRPPRRKPMLYRLTPELIEYLDENEDGHRRQLSRAAAGNGHAPLTLNEQESEMPF